MIRDPYVFLFDHFETDEVLALFADRDAVRAFDGGVVAPDTVADTIPVPTVSTIPCPVHVPTLPSPRAA